MSTLGSPFDPATEYHSISGDGFTLQVNLDVLQTLQSLVQKGITALPKSARRGLEIGGLLFGYDATSVRLEAVQAVTIEHRSGLSYQLSESDIELFQQTIWLARTRSGSGIIGHFRSHTRGELEIAAADLLIAELIGRPRSLVLLINGSRIEPRLARLYRKAAGEFVRLVEFPLAAFTESRPIPAVDSQPDAIAAQAPNEKIASSPAIPPVDAPPEPAAAQIPGDEVAASPPEREETGPPAPVAHRSRLMQWSLAGLLAFAPLVSYIVLRGPPAHDPAAKLGLIVDRSGEALGVSWNWSSPVLLNAISGVLAIEDGNYHRRFELSPSELRSTTILYVPQTATIHFRLEVNQARGRFSSESVTVHWPDDPQKAAHEETGNRPGAVPADLQPSTKRLAAAPTESRSQNTEIHQAPKPRVATAAVPPKGLPEITRSIPPAPLIVEPLEPAPSVTPAPLPTTGPLSVHSLPPPFTSRPVLAPPISYVTAIPVRKISPTVPDSLRPLIQDSLTVEVKVNVDAEGRVSDARPLNASGSSQRLLGPTAVQAAKLWLFEPARRDGQPVASETVLKFDFARQAR